MGTAIKAKEPDEFQFKDIIYEKSGWEARITLNRPRRYNAYSVDTLREITLAVTDASYDDSIAAIVLTGAGTRAFCTGGDVKEYASEYVARPRDYWKYMGVFSGCIQAVLESGKPTIARLNGMAVGGGNELHMACDLSVMGSHTYIGQVGTGVGSVACGGATQWLSLFVGERRARLMLFLNEKVSPKDALDWGLVNYVVPTVRKDGEFIDPPTPEQIDKAQAGSEGYIIDLSRLDEKVGDIVESISRHFPECTRYTKEQVNFWKKFVWYSTVGHARDWLSIHFATREPLEGMTAFVEKRKCDVQALRGSAVKGGSPEFPWGPYLMTCRSCGAKRLPAGFQHCGACGSRIEG